MVYTFMHTSASLPSSENTMTVMFYGCKVRHKQAFRLIIS